MKLKAKSIVSILHISGIDKVLQTKTINQQSYVSLHLNPQYCYCKLHSLSLSLSLSPVIDQKSNALSLYLHSRQVNIL
jgi:hypothetical protein